jgi:hypothetical protein
MPNRSIGRPFVQSRDPLLVTPAEPSYLVRVRSLVKPLAFLFLAMQLLLAMPAGASASESPSGACATMAGVHADGHCPCCPDGVSTLKDCLASCTLAATMTSFHVTVPVVRSHAAVIPLPVTPAAWAADPPLKPPPIA